MPILQESLEMSFCFKALFLLLRIAKLMNLHTLFSCILGVFTKNSIKYIILSYILYKNKLEAIKNYKLF
jgi:hypothetical protein